MTTSRTAELLGLTPIFFEFEEGFDFEQLFVKATAMSVQAIIAPGNPYLNNNLAAFAKLSLQYRLPFVAQNRNFPYVGGLASLGPDLLPRMRRLAYHIDAVLKGAKPGDLPIETPTTFELVVNMKTAKALGLTVPQSILVRAIDLVE